MYDEHKSFEYLVDYADGAYTITGAAVGSKTFEDMGFQLPEFPTEILCVPVTKIAADAFRGMRIRALPSSWGNITDIGDRAFEGNHIRRLPSNWGKVQRIGERIFASNYAVS